MYSSFRANVPGFDAWLDGVRRDHGGRCRVGDTFWMPLPGGRRPHGVVVTVSTGGPRTPLDKADLAVRAALTAAVEHLRAGPVPHGRLLVALPTFRVGLGGDRR